MTFFSTAFIISLVAALLESACFAVIFRTNPRHLPFAGLCGMLTYLVYYTVEFFGMSLFLAGFLSTLFTGIFAEVAARKMRAPAIIYILAGVIPTVPGAALYKTMRGLLSSDYTYALDNLSVAVMVGLGIAGGIVSVSLTAKLLVDFTTRRKKERASRV